MRKVHRDRGDAAAASEVKRGRSFEEAVKAVEARARRVRDAVKAGVEVSPELRTELESMDTLGREVEQLQDGGDQAKLQIMEEAYASAVGAALRVLGLEEG